MNDQQADQEAAGDGLVAYRVEQARKAHALGLVLVRVNGKRPVGKAWQKQPPPSLETVEAWARVGNLGLRTGSVSGVICIDDDTEDQNAGLLGLPTNTPTIITGRGHANRLYRTPADFVVKNSAGCIAEHVDVRGENGMVVFPGSIHPDTGKPYRWADGLSPDDVPFAGLPDETLEMLRPREVALQPFTPPTTAADGRSQRYAAGAFRGAALRVFDAREGARNATLNREAFGLARFIAAGLLARDHVEAVLAEAAGATGLLDAEIAATLRSALDSGLRDSTPFVMPEARP